MNSYLFLPLYGVTNGILMNAVGIIFTLTFMFPARDEYYVI